MKLRDHPLMVRKSGVVSWPPQWQSINRNSGLIQGEVGVLEQVSMHEAIENKIFIAMDHLEERYIAVLAFDDDRFIKQIYLLLLEHVGRSITEVGDLDLSHLL